MVIFPTIILTFNGNDFIRKTISHEDQKYFMKTLIMKKLKRVRKI